MKEKTGRHFESPPMNPTAYLKGFAWISIVALCCSIFSDFWLPMLIGAALIALIYKALR